ncbi:MAG: sialidase family protein [Kiritimatiellae bacterium]|nr:sialidase family protein [Kiritimatiellia bacterium]
MREWTLAGLMLACGLCAQEVPANKTVDVLEDGARAEQPYLAFPAVLDLGAEILVSFKRGHSHAADPGAVLDLLRIDGTSGAAKACPPIAAVSGEIMQMGEWARFANGDIATYIDAQRSKQPSRTGLAVARSRDGGKTFGPVERVGVIDGVEYGYAFESVTRGQTTWMLVMTFTNLTGGTFPQRLLRPVAGSVDVIRSEDSGGTWRFVRSLTRELGGVSINESSFAPCGDGFLVAARGYDARQWLAYADAEFHVTRKVDLTKDNDTITGHIGRPRVFIRDGRWYLMGRNYTMPKTPMRLSLFRFDPETLSIQRHVVLDNDEGRKVADGYYAMPYWREQDGKTRFHVVTYKRGSGAPKIIRLSYDWEEVR